MSTPIKGSTSAIAFLQNCLPKHREKDVIAQIGNKILQTANTNQQIYIGNTAYKIIPNNTDSISTIISALFLQSLAIHDEKKLLELIHSLLQWSDILGDKVQQPLFLALSNLHKIWKPILCPPPSTLDTKRASLKFGKTVSSKAKEFLKIIKSPHFPLSENTENVKNLLCLLNNAYKKVQKVTQQHVSSPEKKKELAALQKKFHLQKLTNLLNRSEIDPAAWKTYLTEVLHPQGPKQVRPLAPSAASTPQGSLVKKTHETALHVMNGVYFASLAGLFYLLNQSEGASYSEQETLMKWGRSLFLQSIARATSELSTAFLPDQYGLKYVKMLLPRIVRFAGEMNVKSATLEKTMMRTLLREARILASKLIIRTTKHFTQKNKSGSLTPIAEATKTIEPAVISAETMVVLAPHCKNIIQQAQKLAATQVTVVPKEPFGKPSDSAQKPIIESLSENVQTVATKVEKEGWASWGRNLLSTGVHKFTRFFI